MNRLLGKTVLVTGAARGIGLAMAKSFLYEGARVVLSDVNVEQLQASVLALDAGDQALAVELDVTDTDSINRAAATIADAGFDINVLVNNAAAIVIGNLLQTSAADLRRVLQVNVEGTFAVSRAFLPGMIARGGGVVLNMASLASVWAMRDRFAYSASKAAIAMMTRSIAIDFVGQGIRANCICPARVQTEFVEEYVRKYYGDQQQEYMNKLSAYQPVGRMITTDEVASMAVYLCSDESAMVTGSSFVIDGGVTAGDGPHVL
jgi:NAD(P)-dependent dehydrogenase (short-subunit alcohol dehydrogenase family)